MGVCVQLHGCVCTTVWGVCVHYLSTCMHIYVHTNVHVFDVCMYDRRVVSSISALCYTVHEYTTCTVYPLYMLLTVCIVYA